MSVQINEYRTAHVDVEKPDGSVFRIEIRGPIHPEDIAVLHTIGAAQKLLAALEDIVKHIHMDIGMQRRAQDAIDEARGVK